MTRRAHILSGLGLVMALTALWHGPLGAGDRMAARIEADSRAQLDRLEMTMVVAHLDRGPLTRTLVLSGPADPFQRSELVRIMAEVHGVSGVKWDEGSRPVAAKITPPLGPIGAPAAKPEER